LPLRYLHGLSTGDFREVLPVLLGEDAVGLSPSAIPRLTETWTAEYTAFRQRDLSGIDYVYVWADGVHFNIRLEEDRLCTLVLIGARPDVTKEVISVEGGYRESTESWLSVPRDLKARGMRRRCWRPAVTKGAGSRTAGLTMAYKLLTMAEQRWRRLNAPHLVAQVRAGGTFTDGIRLEREEVQHAPSAAA